MLPVISALLAFVAGLFRSRASLCLEHLALRHQLAVYQQTIASPAPPFDRSGALGVAVSAMAGLARCPGIRPAPHGDRLAAPALSRSLATGEPAGQPGRPPVAKEVRELIQAMWQANPTWGSPRIVGELRKAGDRRGQIDGGDLPGAATQATVADVEDFSQESRAGPGGSGFLCRANGEAHGALRAAHPGP